MRFRESHEELVKLLFEQPKIREYFTSQRNIHSMPDLQALSQLPPNTLGFHYAALMEAQGFTPDFYVDLPKIETENDFVEIRLRHTHDIWHVVSGFDTTYPGEMGLMGFMLAQLELPVCSLILGSSLLRLSSNREEVRPVMDCVCKGWVHGSQAKPFFGSSWEDMWERDLEEIRRNYDLPVEGCQKASLGR